MLSNRLSTTVYTHASPWLVCNLLSLVWANLWGRSINPRACQHQDLSPHWELNLKAACLWGTVTSSHVRNIKCFTVRSEGDQVPDRVSCAVLFLSSLCSFHVVLATWYVLVKPSNGGMSELSPSLHNTFGCGVHRKPRTSKLLRSCLVSKYTYNTVFNKNKLIAWSPSSAPPDRRSRCCRCLSRTEARCTAWCRLGPQTPGRSSLSRWRSSGSRRWSVWHRNKPWAA